MCGSNVARLHCDSRRHVCVCVCVSMSMSVSVCVRVNVCVCKKVKRLYACVFSLPTLLFHLGTVSLFLSLSCSGCLPYPHHPTRKVFTPYGTSSYPLRDKSVPHPPYGRGPYQPPPYGTSLWHIKPLKSGVFSRFGKAYEQVPALICDTYVCRIVCAATIWGGHFAHREQNNPLKFLENKSEIPHLRVDLNLWKKKSTRS